jgi:thioredoxin 1
VEFSRTSKTKGVTMRIMYAYLFVINLMFSNAVLAAENFVSAVDLAPDQQEFLNQIIQDATMCKKESAEVLDATWVISENYEQTVIQSEKPVIILVSASWCPPCQIFKWIYNRVAVDFKDTFTFVNIDYDSFPEFVQEQGIQSVPMLCFCNDGKLIDTGPAFMPKNDFIIILNAIKDNLNALKDNWKN